MKRTAVLVTGSRDWTNWNRIRERLTRYPKGTILIHGGARGADTIAGIIGRDLGFVIHLIAYFSDLGNEGGNERNACMLGALINLGKYGFDCYVEAFPTKAARGTRKMIRLVNDYNDSTKPGFPLNKEEAE